MSTEVRQFTKEEAIAIARSGEWKDWTDGEVVKVQLFQQLLCVPFDRFHQAMEQVLGRSVFTHEFAFWDLLKAEYLAERPAPTWEEIIGLIPPEKLVVLSIGDEGDGHEL